MTSHFALNNSMISKEEYLDKKAYYDYQRKVEWNREKCMKICEDLKVLDDDEVISSSAIFDIMWHKIPTEEFEEPPRDWVPKDSKWRIEGETYTE